MTSVLQLVKPKHASFVPLSAVENIPALSFLAISKKDEVPIVDETFAEDVKTEVAQENYFSFFDNTLTFFEDEEKKESPYETFTDNLTISEEYISYSLLDTSQTENFFIDSMRFVDDIIFSLNRSNVFEYGALGLSAAVIASLVFLPDNFNEAIALLLSAPLFVCISGIFVKFLKQKNR